MLYKLYKRNTYVIVTVDTVGIINAPEDKISDFVQFSDNRGDRTANGKSFKSIVDEGKDIIWIGIAKNKDNEDNNRDTVQIKKVKRKEEGGGSHILRKDSYEDNNDGVVVGKIRDKSKDNESGTEYYEIEFEVNGNLYKIDPQLEMST